MLIKEFITLNIEEIKIYAILLKRKQTFYCENIKKIIKDASNILSRVPAVFSNYTNHDIEHSFRVANYMFDLLPQPVDFYNDTELTILLYSALLHDIGMAVQETVDISDKISQDNIRRTHHIRSESFILEHLQTSYFMIDNKSDIDFQQTVALIARSHGEDYSWIKNNIPNNICLGNDSVNPQFISCLLRLGDYLDFDSRRTPHILYNFLSLPEISNKEWLKHFSISNYQKINTENNRIYFSGECEDPDTYRAILDYFSLIENEINNAKTLIKSSNDKYNLLINSKIDNQIFHKSFDAADLQYKMDYLSISNLLMGEQLYNDKKCALRELIQNALDAVLVRKELSKQHNIDFTPQIKIIISDKEVIISDNGIGMTLSEINNYFLNLGHSFYNSSEFKDLSTKYKPISHYGIGFLSSFLLSNSIKVKTTSYKQPSERNILLLKKDSRFVIQKKEQSTFPTVGTQIFFSKESFFEVFESTKNITQYILDTFKDCGVQIIISENGSEQQLQFTSNGIKNKIDLSKYLENVECTCYDPFIFSTKSKKMHSIFPATIPFEYFSEYIYDPEELSGKIVNNEEFAELMKKITVPYNINRFIDANNDLRFLNIYPLDYEESEDLSQAQEILGDIDDAFEYVQKRHDLNIYEPIRIYISDEYLFYDFEDYEQIDMENPTPGYDEKAIFTKLLIELVKSKSDFDVSQCVVIPKLQSVFINDNLYTRYDSRRTISNYYNNKLYIKNVKVQFFDITLPIIINGLILSNFELNIQSDNCFPDVSRSRLNNETGKELGYAIGRAIHLYLLDNADLSSSENEFLKSFIDHFYGDIENNRFCRK